MKRLEMLFPKEDQEFWTNALQNVQSITEIRLRSGKPAIAQMGMQEYFLTKEGGFSKNREQSRCFSHEELSAILLRLCRHSLYAYEEELRAGFLTLEGGHRLGVSGETVVEDGKILTMKNIAFLNLRIAHEIRGAADELLPFVYEGSRPLNTLIISPPGCGKTTILRDLIRQISEGNAYGAGCSVSVVDERAEIGGSYLGIPQNDLGIRTDVLCGCPKAMGMRMLIRSMSPRVMAVDELGSREEMEEIHEAKRCGVTVLATLH